MLTWSAFTINQKSGGSWLGYLVGIALVMDGPLNIPTNTTISRGRVPRKATATTVEVEPWKSSSSLRNCQKHQGVPRPWCVLRAHGPRHASTIQPRGRLTSRGLDWQCNQWRCNIRQLGDEARPVTVSSSLEVQAAMKRGCNNITGGGSVMLTIR